MNHKAENENFAFCHTYPKYVIIIRWIILGVAFALGVYILLDLKEALGVLYVIYSVAALTLVLPLSRCVSCYYHGKACHTGWGKVAAYLFPKEDESKFVAHYSYAIFLHLLWLIPLLASFFQLLRKRDVLALIIFFSYLLILLMERITLKKLACARCHQREFCPAIPFRKAK
ncbi:MAG: hypothetical protein AMJ91_04355 [candidate division Zixibacteria bacterium SM23_73_3]|nr:MAG: hypothetical protein AMJ91_04355 [candidate division Zixibacteria bacterium SM23_73_3]